MAITGAKREQKSFEKVVGLFEGRVVSINPTRDQLEDLLGSQVDKDPEYFTDQHEIKNSEGEVIGVGKRLIISVWLEDVKTGLKFNPRFYLVDRNRKNNEGTKYQYMNKQGMSSWPSNGTTEDDLQDWFREAGGVRVAKVGEGDLYEFLRAWLLIDFKNDPEAELSLNWDRLMRNDLTELLDVLHSDLAGTVLALATVRSGKSDSGEFVEYQSVFNKAFLPGSYLRAFRMRGRKTPKALEKFMKTITDPQYGCEDYYVMDELQTYDPSKNEAASDAAHIEAPAQTQATPPAGNPVAGGADLSY